MALENLRLEANNVSTHVLPVSSDPEQIIAQKARHYITSMTKALKVQEAPAGSVINLSLDVCPLFSPQSAYGKMTFLCPFLVPFDTRRRADHSRAGRNGDNPPSPE